MSSGTSSRTSRSRFHHTERKCGACSKNLSGWLGCITFFHFTFKIKLSVASPDLMIFTKRATTISNYASCFWTEFSTRRKKRSHHFMVPDARYVHLILSKRRLAYKTIYSLLICCLSNLSFSITVITPTFHCLSFNTRVVAITFWRNYIRRFCIRVCTLSPRLTIILF